MSDDTPTHVLDDTQAAAYLDRIGVAAPVSPTLATLAAIQRAHVLTVPFENLDIGLGRPIRLELDAVYAKVVTSHRGGYCYELNGILAALLRRLGYRVDVVSARGATSDGGLMPEFDHAALLVDSPELDSRQLVDVGWGDGFLEPIPLVDGVVHDEPGRRVGVVATPSGWTYRTDGGHGWHDCYVFTEQPRALEDFAERNTWQQTSPDSHFTRQRLATLATETGHVTLSGDRLITTANGERSERTLTAAEVTSVPAETFGIRLG